MENQNCFLNGSKRITTLENRKLGGNILQVNMPAVISCRADAPCKSGCYCNHGPMSWIRKHHQERMDAYLECPPKFFSRIHTEIEESGIKVFRWHAAGDIVDAMYFRLMCKLAENLPDVAFLAFTKKYEIVNGYLDACNVIPSNLTVIFSTWGSDWDVPNPHHLPMSFVRTGDAEFDSIIPATAYECPGYCGDCVRGTCGCWSLGKFDSVVFNKH